MPTQDEILHAEKMRRRNERKKLSHAASQGSLHSTESPLTQNSSQSTTTISQSTAEPSQQPPIHNSSVSSQRRSQHNRNPSIGTQLALELQELNVQSQVRPEAPEIPRNVPCMFVLLSAGYKE